MKEKNKKESKQLEMINENGIPYYLDDDGMYYPVFSKTPLYNVASMGKFGIRYARMLYDEDSFAYRKYMLDGTLEQKARQFNEESYQLQDNLVEQALKKWVADRSDTGAVFQTTMQTVQLADEIITAECLAKIRLEKEQRLKGNYEREN